MASSDASTDRGSDGVAGRGARDAGVEATRDGNAVAIDAASRDGGGAAGSATEYSPYFEIGVTTGAFTTLVDMKARSGVSDVTLAFVLSGGGCNTDQTVQRALPDIRAFIAAGGHVKASFGGAAGTYVEAACADAATLAIAISGFVDATGITDLDFDIEQGPVETAAVNAMRGQALKMVQDAKQIVVSFTLPTTPTGLSNTGRAVLAAAVSAGVKISHLNLMTMDYGNMPAGTPMAPIAISSLNGGNTQLKSIFPGLTTAEAWAMLGATALIGQNDDNEIFTLQDALDLTDFARQNKLGLLSFWNIQRDQVCGRGECSQHDVANFDYSNVFITVNSTITTSSLP
jgi:chitinase